jgi:hypothetical protein
MQGFPSISLHVVFYTYVGGHVHMYVRTYVPSQTLSFTMLSLAFNKILTVK